MRQSCKNFALAIALVVTAALVSGCGPARRPYLDDPLLASRHPIDGKPTESPPTRVAFAEPSPLEVPLSALAALPEGAPLQFREEMAALARAQRHGPDKAMATSDRITGKILNVTPAVRRRGTEEIQGTPVLRKRATPNEN